MLGVVYLVVMLIAAFSFRVPPPGWSPPGWVAAVGVSSIAGLTPWQAMLTRSFWLLWVVLFVNVTAGIGILGQASAMCQEMFPTTFDENAATAFVLMLGVFNLVGRFVWSSASDWLGRKRTYAIFFLAGTALYAAVPGTRLLGSPLLFGVALALLMTMYGGGFATIPAYLSDVFGSRYVGAVHGRLLTAWSAAGVAGPVLINYIREYQVKSQIPTAAAYDLTMLLMAGLLVLGFVCNALVRPAPKSPLTSPPP